MFAPFETRSTLPNGVFADRKSRYRVDLIEAQQALRRSDLSLHVVFSGLRGGGQLAMLARLMHWLDPRWVRTVPPPHMKDLRPIPDLAPFWNAMPSRGTIGLYLHGWYTQALASHLHDDVSETAFMAHLKALNDFENMLTAENAVILKVWFHLDEETQKARMEQLSHDPVAGVTLEDADWQKLTARDAFLARALRVIEGTNTDKAPWQIVDGFDDNHRTTAVFDAFLGALEPALKKSKKRLKKKKSLSARAVRQNILEAGAEIASPRLPALDHSQALEADAADALMAQEDRNLVALWSRARAAGLSVVVAMEGPDAGGKGGAIRRLTHALDIRSYKVVPIAAPTSIERAQPWQWRFWHHMGPDRSITIFDRTWYGRVLVEWVEGLIRDKTCMAGYDQINAFEDALIDRGIVLVKLWLDVSPKEQLRRFKDRQKKPYKRWKITDEDWRNRDKRDLYDIAVERMVARTDKPDAPWTLIPSDDKPYARLMVMRAVCEALHARLERLSGKKSQDNARDDRAPSDRGKAFGPGR